MGMVQKMLKTPFWGLEEEQLNSSQWRWRLQKEAQMAVIDADTHVIETDQTWEFMEESDSRFRPEAVVSQRAGASQREWWLIDGRAFRKNRHNPPGVPDGARVLSDVSARIAQMDELGVDVHIVYPSIFLRILTRQPEWELALCRSYNRWLADKWRIGKGRLRWIAVLPLMTMDKALEELHWAKDHGACGLLIRGVEGDKQLADPYFYPLYQEASKLSLPICIHASSGNVAMHELFSPSDSGSFAGFILPVVGAFHDLILKGVPGKFPDLRWGFIEVSSEWVPFVLKNLELRFRKEDRNWSRRNLLRENRMYVACHTADDLGYVLEYTGDDNLVLGSDYGHSDPFAQLATFTKLREEAKIGSDVAKKIEETNPRRFYGL